MTQYLATTQAQALVNRGVAPSRRARDALAGRHELSAVRAVRG